MQYNVSQLLQEPVGATRLYQVDEEIDTSKDQPPNRMRGQLSLMRTDRGVLATARLEAQAQDTCSRCLKLFSQPQTIVFEEEYFPTMDVMIGKPLSAPENAEGSFTIDKRHVLDLREAVRQYSITNDPMKPLCRPDCLGLCPSCGEDRNLGECTCQQDEVDHRWASLRELLRR